MKEAVDGNTLILTNEGYFEIKSLTNRTVSVWNGNEWNTVTINKTIKQALMSIKFSNSSVIKCTPNYKFYIQENGSIKLKNASELQINDELIPFSLPIIKKGKYHEQEICSVMHEDIVPTNHTFDMKKIWFNNFLHRYYEKCKGNGYEIHINSPNCVLLSSIKLMLQTMGCNPDLKVGSLILTSYDIKMLLKDTHKKAIKNNNWIFYELTTDGFDVFNYFDISKINYNIDYDPLKIHVMKIGKLEESIEDTYNFYGHKEGRVIFNGIICSIGSSFGSSKEHNKEHNKDNEENNEFIISIII